MAYLQILAQSLAVLAWTACAGGGFLHHSGHHFQVGDHDFQEALASVMGCSASGLSGREKLQAIEASLMPMWSVAPKNKDGRVDWRIVRYLVHRYFVQSSSLLIRGLEPARQVNETDAGTAEILRRRMPSLAEMLEGKRGGLGFSLEDVTAVVAALERVIADKESSLLDVVYESEHMSHTQSLTHQQITRILEVYMVHWIIDEPQSVKILFQKPALLAEHIPQWEAIRHFSEGLVKSMEFARARTPRQGQGMNSMTQRYSFEDAQEAVTSVTKTFASFWESECQSIKAALLTMDKSGTGRVLLSDFYAAKAAGDWRFGESEDYLRELGALDETSRYAKKVIIPNYMQGANNCLVTNEHYFVCCVNECESVLADIEEAVGSPVASPSEILRPLANLTSFDDEPLKLAGMLTTQLERIAETHGGKVPLHGRLFAQWLHYVMPRECPFPHKAGTTAALPPMEFGNYGVSDADVELHASARGADLEELAEAQSMAQWSDEEELIADYSLQLRAPWQGYRASTPVGLALLALVAFALKTAMDRSEGKAAAGGFGLSEPKAHFV